MKRTILFLTAIVLILASCTDNFEDMNKNKKDPTEVSGESLFTGAQKNLVDLYLECNVNRNNSRLWMQYWTETTYPDESQYDILNRNVPEYHWRVLYRDVLKDLDEATKIITDAEYPGEDPEVKTNKLAIIEVLNCFAWSYLVETFGDVPYTQALDIENLLPVYDDGLTVYKAVLTRLNTAIATLNAATEGSFGSEDNIYQGDVTQWLKFANALKLRMGLNLADIDNALAKTTVEAAAANTFTSNADNAEFAYASAAPNYHPTYASLIASGRKDHTVANTFVNAMQPRTYDSVMLAGDTDSTWAVVSVDYTDPRTAFMFADNIDNDAQGIFAFTVYEGGLQGSGNSYSNYTHPGSRMEEATDPGNIFDFAEVSFMLAEAAERGFTVTGTAEANYNAGITASCEYWGVAAADIATYLALPEVAYTTATGDYKQKIGTQMWFAMFNNGAAEWTHWRRLDWPALDAPADAVPEANGLVPVRYFYPIVEQTLNGSNYDNAVGKLANGDVMYQKLFWDVNDQN